VTVEAEDPDRIDTGRQVAIDHIAAEGVLNAHRHAGARHCQVALTRLDGQTVRLTVTDDGEGVGGSATPGIGLASMRERAVELGGTFTIDSAGRGTRVTVELP
jgi:signal transduction histidine kinase